jgi:hypothetical protein
MITNLTLMCELLIGPTGVKVLPIKADRDCTLNVEELHPLGQSVEKSSRECERVQSSTRVALRLK